MTRIMLAVLLAALAAACTSTGASDPGDGSADAETFKQQMDAEAQTLLPELMSAVGGELNGMQASFTERGGFGIWDYRASGSVVGPAGTVDESLAAATSTLEGRGFTVARNESQKRVTGEKGDISVIVEASALTGRSNGLNLSMGNLSTIGEDDDFAKSAPAEDYLTYLE